MNQSQSPSDSKPGLLRRIRLSVIADPVIPRTEGEQKRFLIRNLVLHFRPTTVPERTLRFSLTWGLGGMAAVLVLLQIGTGVLLKFVYEPTPAAAYASVQTLIHDVPFGRLIRNLHHWCAHLLVLVLLLHMLRVFFTGAFHVPRQFNWIIGLTLFGIVLAANFTGYLLPWDQLAYWAVTVSTGMLEYVPLVGYELRGMIRGGDEIGPDTLRIFYAIHTALVPVTLAMLMAFHFWRVRKAGGLVIPREPDESTIERPDRVPALPNLILREAVVALILIAMVMLWSVFMDAPLTDPANPGLSPNPTKAPWYFAGLQELLMHLHPVVAVFIVPFVLGIGLLAIPYMKYESNTNGIWFASRTGRKTGIIAATTAFIITPVLILIDELAGPGQIFSGIPLFITNGLAPILFILAVIVAFVWVIKRRFCASRNEVVQAVFIMLLVALALLTLTCVWFRAEGMVLAVPWR